MARLQALGSNNELNIKIVEYDKSHDQRSQAILNEDMSQQNRQLVMIFIKELRVHDNLSIGERFHNLVHDEEKIYCFKDKTCKVIYDLNVKFNRFNKNSLYMIDYHWYRQFHRKGKGLTYFFASDKQQRIKESRTMYTTIKDAQFDVITQKFIQWPGDGVDPTDQQGQIALEYEIVWNQKYNCSIGPNEENGQPLETTWTRKADSKWNPLLVKFQNLRYQEDSYSQTPFIGMKQKERGVYEQIWLAILDRSKKHQITDCHMLDLSKIELDNIQQIHMVQCSQLIIGDGVQTQNFQICVWFGDKLWRCKIFEYQIKWFEPKEVGVDTITTQVIQIGIKELIGTMDTKSEEILQMHFFPLFNNDHKIIGSQIMFKMKNELKDIIIINMENFANKDWEFMTLTCKFGFKFYNKKYKFHKKFTLFESQFRKEVLFQIKLFNDYDRSQILFNQIKASINMVYISVHSYLIKMDTIDEDLFNFFQPLKLLNGLSLCDYYLNDPTKIMGKTDIQFKRIEKKQDLEFYQSHLDQLLSSDLNDDRIQYFIQIGYLSLLNPNASSLKTPLEKCFNLDKIPHQTVNTMMKTLFEHPPSKFTVNLIRTIIFCIYERSINEYYDWDFSPKFLTFFDTNKNTKNGEYNSMTWEYYFDDISLPKGSDQQNRVITFSPENVSTLSMKSQLKDVIQSKKHDKGSEYQIEYSYLDLRIMNWVKKLRLFRKVTRDHMDHNHGAIDHELEIEKMSFTALSDLFETLLYNSEDEIEQWFCIQKIIDFIFYNYTQTFFKYQFIVFIILFVIPFFVNEYCYDQDIMIVCMCTCQLCIIILFVIEVMDYKANGAKSSLSFWDKNDWGLIITFTIDFCLKWSIGFEPISENTRTIQQCDILVNLLRSVIIIMSTVKTMSYLRTFEKFAQMVSLLSIVLGDLFHFCVFYMLIILTFSIIQKVNFVTYDGSGFPNIPQDIVMVLQTFENSIGNIANPSYDKLLHHRDPNLSSLLYNIQLIVIWSLWFLCQFFILVIVLNFLISVISETYSGVINRQTMHSYSYRNELNLEYLRIVDAWQSNRQDIDILLIISDEKCSTEAVTELKEIRNEIITHTNATISETEKRLSNKFTNSIETELSSIKQMLVDVVNQQKDIREQINK